MVKNRIQRLEQALADIESGKSFPEPYTGREAEEARMEKLAQEGYVKLSKRIYSAVSKLAKKRNMRVDEFIAHVVKAEEKRS